MDISVPPAALKGHHSENVRQTSDQMPEVQEDTFVKQLSAPVSAEEAS